MRKILSRIRTLLGRPRPHRVAKLTRAQSLTLRRNLREILLSKEVLSDRNESAA